MAKKENKRKAPTKGKGNREEKRKKKKAADKDKRKRLRDEDDKPEATAKSGPGVTMIKVMRANDGAPLGYYKNKAKASRAMGDDKKMAATDALNRKGDMKGVVRCDGLFKVEEVHNCTEPEGPTALGMQEGKWKMADHAPGPGSGSNNSRIGITLGRCLNSSKEKIPNDTEGRTFGDVIKGVASSKHGVQRHGFVIYDGDMFAKIMAWEKSTIGSKLAKLKKKGSNKKSRRLDNGKKGSFPQFWYVDGLKRGLDDYTVFALS